MHLLGRQEQASVCFPVNWLISALVFGGEAAEMEQWWPNGQGRGDGSIQEVRNTRWAVVMEDPRRLLAG